MAPSSQGLEPPANPGRFNLLGGQDLPLDGVEELNELLVPMALPVLTDDGAVEHVEGGEQMVLHGMGERLKETDILIIEESLIATLQGEAPEFADICAFMRDNSMAIYDLIGINRRSLDGAIAQLDAISVQETLPLRRDQRWAATRI